ncbi:MAG: hypothetical protein ABFR97_04970, partial [Thermodesulfobacteriota bacterium]
LPLVTIRQEEPDPSQKEEPFFTFSPDDGLTEIVLHTPGVGSFTISQGTKITIQPVLPAPPASILALYLTGSVLSLLLYQRGLTVLHGSVVTIAGQAVTFLGHSGAGKSSVAAACLQQGHSLLADDAAAIELNRDQSMVLPGFPRLKVHEKTIQALAMATEGLTVIEDDDGGKEYALPVQEQFAATPAPLAAIYLLDYDADRVRVEKVSPASALIELLPHAMPSRYGQSGGAQQFGQLSRLVKEVPVFRLQRPRNLDQLQLIPEFIEKHLAGLR